jgi:iron(III) transport system substrate-binding protein
MYFFRIATLFLLVVFIYGCSPQEQTDNVEGITVYSSRAEHLIKPLFDAFTAQTGIPVRYTTDSEAALISRLEAEGENTPADILLTVDAGNLWFADSKNLFQAVDSSVLQRNVPENLRSQAGTWFGLSVRARTIVYSTDRVDEQNLDSYESLADPEWQGRLCLRTSKKVYNQSLVASLITRLGIEETENIVASWVENLAVEPLGSDNQAIEAVVAGVCDVTVVNTYYFGRMKADNPEIPAAIFWPNQSTSGVHLNVSGAGITRNAPNPALAQRLLEWLSESEAQAIFAGLNKEFPVNPSVDAIDQVQAWGDFTADSLHVEEVGRLQAEAVMLMDRAGYK